MTHTSILHRNKSENLGAATFSSPTLPTSTKWPDSEMPLSEGELVDGIKSIELYLLATRKGQAVQTPESDTPADEIPLMFAPRGFDVDPPLGT